jgi:hypothetical protein
MAIVTGRCASCGREVRAKFPDFPGVKEINHAVCPECGEKELVEEGGSVMVLDKVPAVAVFSPGRVTVTPGAVKLLGDAGVVSDYLLRHLAGDWGTTGSLDKITVTREELRGGCLATDDVGKLNAIAVQLGLGTVHSVYETPDGEELWVITDLDPGDGTNRTTVMLPGEY